MTHKKPSPALPRRLKADLEVIWDRPEDIPHHYLLAGIWAFLQAAPRTDLQKARFLGAWDLGMKGLVPLIKELEPIWMEASLIEARPELGSRGLSDQRKRLIGHLVGMEYTTLKKMAGANFEARPTYASEFLPEVDKAELPPGPIGVSPKTNTTIARGNAFALDLTAFGGEEPRLSSIACHSAPGPFLPWVSTRSQEARVQEAGQAPLSRLEGCHLVAGFMNHGVIKFVSLAGGVLRLGYEFCFLKQESSGSKAPRLQLQFLSHWIMQELHLHDPAPQTMRELLEAGERAFLYSQQ